VDVNALAKLFGGGGHRQAAGCTLPGSLDVTKAQFLAAAELHLAGSGA
jgi:phosphoesterase RecJ-like protein